MRWHAIAFSGAALAVAGCKSTCSRPLTTRVQAGKTVTLTISCDIS